MLLKKVIKIDQGKITFSESSVFQIYFELLSISNNLRSSFRGFFSAYPFAIV